MRKERVGRSILRSLFALGKQEFIFDSYSTLDGNIIRLENTFNSIIDEMRPFYETVAIGGSFFGRDQVIKANIRNQKFNIKTPEIEITVNWSQADQAVLDWLNGGGDFTTGYFDLITALMQQSNRNWLIREYERYINGEQSLQTTRDRLSNLVFGNDRSERIIRTDITAIWARGQQESYRASGTQRNQWQTRFDELVCPICGPLHTAVAEIGDNFHGINTSHPPAHVSCVLPDTEVLFPFGVSAAFKSFYSGKVIKLTTNMGRILTCTENHPILTPSGVIAANLLTEGMDVLTSSNSQWVAFGIQPYNNNVPTTAEQVFSSLQKSSFMLSHTMPSTPKDFYGDGRLIDGNINVVYSDRFLLGNIISKFSKLIRQHSFNEGSLGQSLFSGDRRLNKGLFRNFASSNSVMGSFDSMFSLFFAHLLPSYNHAFTSSPVGVVSIDKQLCYGIPTNLERFSHLFNRLSTFMQTDKIIDIGKLIASSMTFPSFNSSFVKSTIDSSFPNFVNVSNFLGGFSSFIKIDSIVNIEIIDFSGHVYTFQTNDSEYPIYNSNGILSNNCRCFLSPVPLSTNELENLLRNRNLYSVNINDNRSL